MHHQNLPVCPSCAEKLNQAHPYLRAWFRGRVSAKDMSAHISWSYRDQANQEQCFTEGKTRAHYPHSPHNHLDESGKPLSIALDLFQLSSDGRAQFNPLWYARIAADAKRNGDMIIWGGDFKSIGDSDHFQIKEIDGHLPDSWGSIKLPDDAA